MHGPPRLPRARRVAAALALGFVAGTAGCAGGAGTAAGPEPAPTSVPERGAAGSPADPAPEPPGPAADPAPATTTPVTTTSAPPVPDPVTLAFSGDVLLHMPVNDRAAAYGAASGGGFDFRPMFEALRPVLEPADLALCHLEVPVAPDGRLTSYPSFGAPAQVVDGIAHGGFDGCSTASNHSLDRGYAGVVRTLEELDRVGLRHAGTARGPWETGPGLYRVGEPGAEVDVAHLSYAYGFNGYRLPADAPWAASGIDPDRIRADAAAARAAGAELVVVSLHWGTEYRHEPDAYQRSIADRMLPGAEIDLVIGHHAHVVQPIEVVHGRYVVWGLGNQLSNQTQAPRRDGLTVVVTAGPGWDGRWHVSGVEAVPTWVDLATFRILPVARTLADPATPPALRAELEASHARTAAIVAAPGTPGVTVTPLP